MKPCTSNIFFLHVLLQDIHCCYTAYATVTLDRICCGRCYTAFLVPVPGGRKVTDKRPTLALHTTIVYMVGIVHGRCTCHTKGMLSQMELVWWPWLGHDVLLPYEMMAR